MSELYIWCASQQYCNIAAHYKNNILRSPRLDLEASLFVLEQAGLRKAPRVKPERSK